MSIEKIKSNQTLCRSKLANLFGILGVLTAILVLENPRTVEATDKVNIEIAEINEFRENFRELLGTEVAPTIVQAEIIEEANHVLESRFLVPNVLMKRQKEINTAMVDDSSIGIASMDLMLDCSEADTKILRKLVPFKIDLGEASVSLAEQSLDLLIQNVSDLEQVDLSEKIMESNGLTMNVQLEISWSAWKIANLIKRIAVNRSLEYFEIAKDSNLEKRLREFLLKHTERKSNIVIKRHQNGSGSIRIKNDEGMYEIKLSSETIDKIFGGMKNAFKRRFEQSKEV